MTLTSPRHGDRVRAKTDLGLTPRGTYGTVLTATDYGATVRWDYAPGRPIRHTEFPSKAACLADCLLLYAHDQEYPSC